MPRIDGRRSSGYAGEFCARGPSGTPARRTAVAAPQHAALRRYPSAVVDDDGRGARSAAWGVVAVVFGGGAAAAWVAVPGGSSVVLAAACACSVAAATGLYMCFAMLNDWWPGKRSLPIIESSRRQNTLGATDAAPRPSILPTLRDLAVEGRSLQGSITNRGPMATMPPGLPDRVEGWERSVSAALESRPNLRAQFEAPPGARFAFLHSPTDDLYHRLQAHLGVLDAIVQGLAGPGGEG